MLRPEKRGKFYNIGNKKLISVTAVLSAINKPQLVTWAARCAAEIALSEPAMSTEKVISAVFQKRENAAEIGSYVHDVIQCVNAKEKFDISIVPEALHGYIHAFQSFCSAFKPTTLQCEQVCYSLKHEYAGTSDWVISLPNNEIWLIDFKTGGIYREAGLQISAYKNAIEEMAHQKLIMLPSSKIDKTGVVRLRADGTFDLRFFDEPLDIFLSVKKLWEWQNQAD